VADAYISTDIDNPSKYTIDTSARCVPCLLGEFCPQGTYEGIGAGVKPALLARKCSAGSYCANATVQSICPAGTYCVEGSTEQYTCNYKQLIFQDALARMPIKSPTVLERLYVQGDPLGGNYCPEGSDSPLSRCVLHMQAVNLDGGHGACPADLLLHTATALERCSVELE
jgi:hypothetical protein